MNVDKMIEDEKIVNDHRGKEFRLNDSGQNAFTYKMTVGN
jgi:hypothetical protein